MTMALLMPQRGADGSCLHREMESTESGQEYDKGVHVLTVHLKLTLKQI